MSIRKRLGICARFGLGDKILAHSLTNVKVTSAQKMKILSECNFSCLGKCNSKYIRGTLYHRNKNRERIEQICTLGKALCCGP
jgi:hypothetical protein